MKTCIITVKKLWVGGIALFPFIIISKNVNGTKKKVLLNHELIHIKQQLELAIIPFYFLYVLFYVIHLIKYRNHYKAYRAIAFEKEAYLHQNNLNYPDKRKWWAWCDYIGI
ncbi:MAG: hypothetical protein ABIT08_05305 [Bacteroidia bacterium]